MRAHGVGQAAARLQVRGVLTQVLPGAEGPARAGQQHGPDRAVFRGAAQGGEELLLGLSGQRVHRLGTVEGDGGDGVGRLVADHINSLSTNAAAAGSSRAASCSK